MRSRVLILLAALIVALQGCCCCTAVGGPEPPYTIAPSDEALRRFQERLESAGQGTGDTFTVTITEQEMTSLVTKALAAQTGVSPIGEPQVHFRNGRVELYAMLQVIGSWASVPGMIALSIDVADGQAEFAVEEVALGPLPVPQAVLEAVTDLLSQALNASFEIEGVEVAITEIQVGQGEMTVSARIPSN